MLMSLSQQKKPRSGDQRRVNGGVEFVLWKHTSMGPKVAPPENSWRVHVSQPAALVTSPED